jgi:hypothetical protein
MADWGGKVATWFAAVAGVSATLATLIAATSKSPLRGGPRDLFIALVVIAAVSFAALVLTGPPALWSAWRNRGTRKVQDLAARADTLSGELFAFTGERDQYDPGKEMPLRSAGISDAQWQPQWDAYSRRIVTFSNQTRHRYDAQFRVRALAVFNDAVEAGLEQEKRREMVENPTNVIRMRKVAEMMGIIAETARRPRCLDEDTDKQACQTAMGRGPKR